MLFRQDPSQLSRVRATLQCRHGHRDVQAPLFRARIGGDIKVPKAVDAAFSGVDDEISALIAAYRSVRARKLETDLFEQRTRLAAAEKKLAVKVTKKASEDVRIATDKVDAATRGLDDLRRQDLQERDSRIFPGWYAPVLIELDGKRLVVPMRYRCRIRGMAGIRKKSATSQLTMLIL